MNLPAETSPHLAPDRLSVWPMEDGRYGLDATYHGATGFERAEAQQHRLHAANLQASVRQELGDDWTLRLGPLTQSAVLTAIEGLPRPSRPSHGTAVDSQPEMAVWGWDGDGPVASKRLAAASSGDACNLCL